MVCEGSHGPAQHQRIIESPSPSSNPTAFPRERSCAGFTDTTRTPIASRAFPKRGAGGVTASCLSPPSRLTTQPCRATGLWMCRTMEPKHTSICGKRRTDELMMKRHHASIYDSCQVGTLLHAAVQKGRDARDNSFHIRY
jgi:hypothetical protein